LGISRGTLSVVFVSERKMREINRRYRDRDYATDVLSFEYGTATAEGSPLLGEVVIAPQVAWRQAVRWHSRPERELRRLLVHGILHLLGYDHETDSGTMDSLQRRLLRRKSLTRAVLAEESAERK
jgi:probable rRNA maturation factor